MKRHTVHVAVGLVLVLSGFARAQDQDGGVPEQVETLAVEAPAIPSQFSIQEDSSFGEAVLAPGGLIWSRRSVGYAENVSSSQGPQGPSEAAKLCRRLGGRLPSAIEAESLMNQFSRDDHRKLTAEGKAEFEKWFPKSSRAQYWTSTEVAGRGQTLGYAYALSGHNGRIDLESPLSVLSVLCVKDPSPAPTL